jgi:hypothetical protein
MIQTISLDDLDGKGKVHQVVKIPIPISLYDDVVMGVYGYGINLFCRAIKDVTQPSCMQAADCVITIAPGPTVGYPLRLPRLWPG